MIGAPISDHYRTKLAETRLRLTEEKKFRLKGIWVITKHLNYKVFR